MRINDVPSRPFQRQIGQIRRKMKAMEWWEDVWVMYDTSCEGILSYFFSKGNNLPCNTYSYHL